MGKKHRLPIVIRDCLSCPTFQRLHLFAHCCCNDCDGCGGRYCVPEAFIAGGQLGLTLLGVSVRLMTAVEF